MSKLIILIISRTIKWKCSIDDSGRSPDGSYLPCILIENKIDLVTKDVSSDDSKLKEFSDKYNFISSFRTSAKTGENINEAMEYLIKYIADKMDMNPKDSESFDKQTNSIVLQNDKHINSKKKNKCC